MTFDVNVQRVMIDELLVASGFQKFRLHAVGSDESHLHVLSSWRDDRIGDQLQRSIRSSLSRRLNKEFGKRTWFVENSSHRRVKTRDHFDHLVQTYIPDHPGWKWDPKKGTYL